MESINKVFIALLILCTLNIYFPNVSSAQSNNMPAKVSITMHPIKSRASVNKEIGTDTPQKSNWWIWGLLGALLVGGAAAAAAGGDSGSSTPSTTSSTGSASISW